jgi:DNA-binding NarL/FixJ family response regulator
VERTRVLIVDDHPLFRQGLCWALRTERDFEVVGEAGSGQEALRLARELSPDMVLCDVRLPDVTGIDVTRRLKMHDPDLPVVLMSAYDDEEQLFEAVRVGAAGFFMKDTTPAPLLDGLRRAARGESLIGECALEQPVLATRVLHQFRQVHGQAGEIEPLFIPLSTRETEILDLIARGNSNKLIARILTISDQTVKNHITSILRKLAVNDRTQAVVFALRKGWIRVGTA